MSYLDVITIDQARTYLRIDDAQNESDFEIISMINAACKVVEKATNVLFYARDVVYDLAEGNDVYVYDYPINSFTPSAGQEVQVFKKNLYSVYRKNDDQPITFNVGYVNPDDVPDDLIQCALALVKVMYYESENEKPILMAAPSWVSEVLQQNRRFLI